MDRESDIPIQEPPFCTFATLLKATPQTDGDRRFVYVEASKETKDQQNEIVLAAALKKSVDIFRKFGVVDLDHKSMPAVAKRYGIDNPDAWIIGQPVDVRFDRDMTFVKSELRRGDSPLAERANRVWEGLTQVSPPDRYYASVGGGIEATEDRLDPNTHLLTRCITTVRWDNLGFSRSPVHAGLNPASAVPIGVFTKSLNAFVLKDLTAGYGTDSASLIGGGSLREQSLHGVPIAYFDFKTHIADAIRRRDSNLMADDRPIRSRLVDWAQSVGIDPAHAGSWVNRFLFDITTDLRKNR